MKRPEILNPVFHFLDRLIHEHGDVQYVLFVYIAIPLIACILSGGFWRRPPSRRHIVMARPVI